MKAQTVTMFVAVALAWSSLLGAAPRPGEHPEPARPLFPGKPTGPIAVDYRVAAPPAVGTPLEIEVTARVQGAADGLAIEATPSVPGAVLVTPATLVTAGDGVYSWQITVVPLTADAGYLSVIVAGTVDGVPQARSVTVSLRSAAAAEPAPTAAGAAGEALIALPVQESR